MAENFITDGHDGLTYSGIVHRLLDKIITELAIKEFRGGYQKPVMMNGNPHLDYVPDSRAEYIQSIEALSDILLPKFDDKMKEDYKNYESELDKLGDLDKGEMIMGDDNHKKYIRGKVILIRKLFQKLNLLLSRTNYLKTSPREEEDEDEE